MCIRDRGKSIGLPAIWVLAAITVGGSLMGIAGMLISVPITAALYRLLKEDMRRQGLKKLIARRKKAGMAKQEKEDVYKRQVPGTGCAPAA